MSKCAQHFCQLFLTHKQTTEGKSDTRHVLPSTFAKHFCQLFLTGGKSYQALLPSLFDTRQILPSTFAKHFCHPFLRGGKSCQALLPSTFAGQNLLVLTLPWENQYIYIYIFFFSGGKKKHATATWLPGAPPSPPASAS